MPAELNRCWCDGEIDVALPSSIEYARHADVLALLAARVDQLGRRGRLGPALHAACRWREVAQRRADGEERHLGLPAARSSAASGGSRPSSSPRVGPLAECSAVSTACCSSATRRCTCCAPACSRYNLDLGEAWQRGHAACRWCSPSAPRGATSSPRGRRRPPPSGGAARVARPLRRASPRADGRRTPRCSTTSASAFLVRVLRPAQVRVHRRVSARPCASSSAAPPRSASSTPSPTSQPEPGDGVEPSPQAAASTPAAASPTPRPSTCSSAATCSSSASRADELRRRLHPGGEVTFIVDRNINYTNVCLSGCRFCAFYRTPGERGGLRARAGGDPPQDRGDARRSAARRS